MPANLLEDDVPFEVNLTGGETGVKDQIRQDAERRLEPLGRGLGVKEGRFLASGCVEMAADRVDLLRDRDRIPRLGPFEYEVLDEMGQTGKVRRIVTASYPDPDSHGNRTRLRNLIDENPQSVLQFRLICPRIERLDYQRSSNSSASGARDVEAGWASSSTGSSLRLLS